MAIAGPLLLFIGIIVLIIGGIFLLKERIRKGKYNTGKNK
jgi:uncharacterized membrane protein